MSKDIQETEVKCVLEKDFWSAMEKVSVFSSDVSGIKKDIALISDRQKEISEGLNDVIVSNNNLAFKIMEFKEMSSGELDKYKLEVEKTIGPRLMAIELTKDKALNGYKLEIEKDVKSKLIGMNIKIGGIIGILLLIFNTTFVVIYSKILSSIIDQLKIVGHP